MVDCFMNARTALAALALVTAAPSALAADPVALSKDEVQAALSGKSITYASTTGAGGEIVIFFAADGRMTLKFTGSPRVSSGTWSVDDSGRYCLKFVSGTATDGCRQFLKTDTGYATKSGRGEIVPVNKME